MSVKVEERDSRVKGEVKSGDMMVRKGGKLGADWVAPDGMELFWGKCSKVRVEGGEGDEELVIEEFNIEGDLRYRIPRDISWKEAQGVIGHWKRHWELWDWVFSEGGPIIFNEVVYISESDFPGELSVMFKGGLEDEGEEYVIRYSIPEAIERADIPILMEKWFDYLRSGDTWWEKPDGGFFLFSNCEDIWTEASSYLGDVIYPPGKTLTVKFNTAGKLVYRIPSDLSYAEARWLRNRWEQYCLAVRGGSSVVEKEVPMVVGGSGSLKERETLKEGWCKHREEKVSMRADWATPTGIDIFFDRCEDIRIVEGEGDVRTLVIMEFKVNGGLSYGIPRELSLREARGVVARWKHYWRVLRKGSDEPDWVFPEGAPLYFDEVLYIEESRDSLTVMFKGELSKDGKVFSDAYSIPGCISADDVRLLLDKWFSYLGMEGLEFITPSGEALPFSKCGDIRISDRDSSGGLWLVAEFDIPVGTIVYRIPEDTSLREAEGIETRWKQYCLAVKRKKSEVVRDDDIVETLESLGEVLSDLASQMGEQNAAIRELVGELSPRKMSGGGSSKVMKGRSGIFSLTEGERNSFYMGVTKFCRTLPIKFDSREALSSFWDNLGVATVLCSSCKRRVPAERFFVDDDGNDVGIDCCGGEIWDIKLGGE